MDTDYSCHLLNLHFTTDTDIKEFARNSRTKDRTGRKSSSERKQNTEAKKELEFININLIVENLTINYLDSYSQNCLSQNQIE